MTLVFYSDRSPLIPRGSLPSMKSVNNIIHTEGSVASWDLYQMTSHCTDVDYIERVSDRWRATYYCRCRPTINRSGIFISFLWLIDERIKNNVYSFRRTCIYFNNILRSTLICSNIQVAYNLCNRVRFHYKLQCIYF